MSRVFSGELPANLKCVVVVMAGGHGTRFWPASRRHFPKQFLSLGVGKPSLLQSTVSRLELLGDKNGIIIVAGKNQRDLVFRQLPEVALLEEPLARNTAACLGYSAVAVWKTVGDVPMVCVPADHYVSGEANLVKLLNSAVDVASREDVLVTIGIKPTAPETAYGYIQIEKRELANREGLECQSFRVRRFVEKPGREVAMQYLESGDYFWNSGMFVWRPSVLLQAIDAYLPELGRQLLAIGGMWGRDGESEAIREIFANIKPISIDFGVMERASNVVMMKGDSFEWSDVGSWGAWAECLSAVEQCHEGNNVIDGDAMLLNSRNSMILSNHRFVAGVGLDNIIIVEMGDAILVCNRNADQEVREVVEELSRRKREDLL
ncbi:MAG: mannose-1-phosphate guanylyltransferase [Deltaproteobacteria bacterium]|nr:mannose-1-phosphate guanylyltransferase [Deltaproteobacteria bacterium]